MPLMRLGDSSGAATGSAYLQVPSEARGGGPDSAPAALPLFYPATLFPELTVALIPPEPLKPEPVFFNPPPLHELSPELFEFLEEFESPTLAPVDPPTVHAASGGGDSLTEAEMVVLLRDTGWPEEVIPQALAVAWCESRFSSGAVGDSGRSVGIFQLNKATWFGYAGEDPEMWADAHVNARTALRTYWYDLDRGYAPFNQWSCKP